MDKVYCKKCKYYCKIHSALDYSPDFQGCKFFGESRPTPTQSNFHYGNCDKENENNDCKEYVYQSMFIKILKELFIYAIIFGIIGIVLGCFLMICELM